MSFLKNFLKPFVEFKPEEENTSGRQDKKLQQADVHEKDKETTTNTENSTINTATLSSSLSATTTNNSATIKEYNKYFENLIEEANGKNPLFQGTDFKEFIDSKVDVESIADEGTRYKTAFNVLKRTGLTKERLVTTGQEYIKLIDQDLKGFADAYNQQYKADVEQKEQLLQKKAEELRALNEKISSLNAEMKQLSQQVVENKEKLDMNKNAFVNAGQEKKKEIEVELQKINQYF